LQSFDLSITDNSILSTNHCEIFGRRGVAGIDIPTIDGVQRVLPVLAPPTADLIDMYKNCSQKKCAGFEELNEACNECNIPGYKS
jgi:hypothetical protein